MPQFLDRPDGETLAYTNQPGVGPGIIWLSGFRSDMTGTKATHLAAWAKQENHPFLAFDYFGHGASSGEFTEGTIGRWLSDSLAAIDSLSEGPQVLVGSSMGGWLALLAALARPERTHALVLIAPAPDFTEDLMWAEMDEKTRKTLETEGVWHRPTAYGERPYPIAYQLIQEGRNHLLLGGPIAISCKVHILHGMLDADVPFKRSIILAERLASRNVIVEAKKVGDHRLSMPEDLERLIEVVRAATHTERGRTNALP